ncbi:MAG: hypothetical protein Sylvanvirus24_1, partial [Sylvanvirus sp.]
MLTIIFILLEDLEFPCCSLYYLHPQDEKLNDPFLTQQQENNHEPPVPRETLHYFVLNDLPERHSSASISIVRSAEDSAYIEAFGLNLESVRYLADRITLMIKFTHPTGRP